MTRRSVGDGNCGAKTSGKAQYPQRAAGAVVACPSAARGRAKSSARGSGRFFGIEVAPARRFVASRYHDLGKKGGIERVAGQLPKGTWETAGWLISKDLAHVEHGRLVPDSVEARKVLSALRVTPSHVGGDRFEAEGNRTTSRRSSRQVEQNQQMGVPIGRDRNMSERLTEVIDDLRADIGRVEEPQFEAMFETAAEVLGGLLTAFRHYEEKTERAW